MFLKVVESKFLLKTKCLIVHFVKHGALDFRPEYFQVQNDQKGPDSEANGYFKMSKKRDASFNFTKR